MDIKELPFVRARLLLLDASSLHDSADRNRSRDRTVEPVRRWVALTDELKTIRPLTMGCVEVRPGKGDGVALTVVNKVRLKELWEILDDRIQKVEALEKALEKLDTLGPDLWYSTISQRFSALMGTEGNHKRRLSAEASNAMARNAGRGMAPDEILQNDSRFLQIQEVLAADLEAAKVTLEELEPKYTELKSILEAAGC
jgi:hypothetical protein